MWCFDAHMCCVILELGNQVPLSEMKNKNHYSLWYESRDWKVMAWNSYESETGDLCVYKSLQLSLGTACV